MLSTQGRRYSRVYNKTQHSTSYNNAHLHQVTIHADSSRTTPGSRRYIHAKDVSDGLLFILSLPKDYKHKGDFGGAKCPKFNLVGEEEVDNLALANIIADTVGKELKYKLVDFHSSRPGHDLR